MTRKAWIDGDPFDLEALTRHFQTGPIRVVREDGGFYLTATEIDAAPDDVQANDVAIRIIGRINALGRIHDSNFRPVRLSRYTAHDGRSHVISAMASTMATPRTSATMTVTQPDGTVVPGPPSPWPDYLARADQYPDVAEALGIMQRTEPLGWDDLWKLFEIIREAVKPDTIITLGWIDAADLNAFKESANHPDVSGDEARHARRPDQPQHRQVAITEGRSLISDLLKKWLDSLT